MSGEALLLQDTGSTGVWVAMFAAGLAGVWLWKRLARPGRVHALQPDDTSRHGVAIFLGTLFFQRLIVQLLLGSDEGLPDDVTLAQLAASLALAGLLASVLVFGLASRLGVDLGGLGLRRHVGAPAPLLALAGWLTCLPFVAFANLLSRGLAPWVFQEPSLLRQDYLERFVTEAGASSDSVVWVCMVVVIPVVEELIFRGGLFGGMRRLLPPAAAMVLSGMLFGAVHDPIAMLPAAALGVMLAWLYERTGSLVAPCLAHMFQNGFTLVLAATFPEAQ